MTLVGYDSDSPNYRVMDQKTLQITITRDVIFNEKGNNNQQLESNKHAIFSIQETDYGEPVYTTDDDPAEEEDYKDASEDPNDAKEENRAKNMETDPPRTLRDRSKIQPPDRYNVGHQLACAAIVTEEPRSYSEAMSSSKAECWHQAMMEEMDSHATNKTWSLVPLPIGRKEIDCKWVYKIKRGSDGSIERYKARLCARGFLQEKGIDFHDTFSPIIRYESIRVLLALATM